jgi:glutathione synthase/RimK-type ligase-like ATP-grasp enzyme
MILLHTVSDDVHALEVHRRVLDRGYHDCFLIESDRIAGQESLAFEIGPHSRCGLLRAHQGRQIDVGDVRLIWFRRCATKQAFQSDSHDPVARDLVNNECRDTLAGVLEAEFHGKWLSTPASTIRASNKILQLAAASKCGFRVPRTLVSQSKPRVLDFYNAEEGSVITKAISGTSNRLFATHKLKDPIEIGDESYLACPTLCQEFIPGTRNIRLHCFGQSSHAVLIDSPHVDSRFDLGVPIEVWPVPAAVHNLTRRVLDELGLEMGVVDLKETPDGELVWFEVNPQGQFLYLEPLSDLKIGDIFVDYLLDEVRAL